MINQCNVPPKRWTHRKDRDKEKDTWRCVVKNKGERRRFDKEFKQEVVRLVLEGGRQVSEVTRDLDIHPNVRHRWKREYLEDTEHAFPSK